MKRIPLLLVVIIAVAFALRAMGMDFGLPSKTKTLATYHPDESIHLYSLEHINPATGDFYPGDALYWGSFHFYLQGALSKLAAETGMVTLGDRSFLLQHPEETDKLYVIGRLISVFFGTAAVIIFFLLGRRLYGRAGGYVGAIFMALAPLAVTTSFYAKPDGVMFFWYLCSILLAVAAVEKRQRRYYILYGIFLGLATASKYSALLSFGFFLLLHIADLVRARRPLYRNTGDIALLVVCAFGAFVIANPYAVIRPADFMHYFNGVMGSKTVMPSNLISGYADYLIGILPAAVGWPMYIFALGGIVLSLRTPSKIEIAMGGFALVYVLRLGPPRGQALTYCLPLVPFMILFAVKFALRIGATRNGRLLTAVVCAYTLAYAVSYKSLFSGVDPREDASRWIERNIPAGAVIGMSKNDFWTPPAVKVAGSRYRVVCGASPQRPLSEGVRALPDVVWTADYIVLTSDEYYEYERYPREFPEEAAAIDTVRDDFDEVASFAKSVDLLGIPYYRDYVTLDWMFPNPTVRILKRKSIS
jgi:hypothetical protein